MVGEMAEQQAAVHEGVDAPAGRVVLPGVVGVELGEVGSPVVLEGVQLVRDRLGQLGIDRWMRFQPVERTTACLLVRRSTDVHADKRKRLVP